MPVVGDEHDRPGVGAQGILQYVATRKVKMIGGLIQNQEVHRNGECLGQCQSGLFATRQVTDEAVHGVTTEPEGSQVGAWVATVGANTWHGTELVDHGSLLVEDLGLQLVKVRQVHICSP